MQLARTSFATHPLHGQRRFGRGPVRVDAIAVPAPRAILSNEVKLFASTFAAGFLFVSILIG